MFHFYDFARMKLSLVGISSGNDAFVPGLTECWFGNMLKFGKFLLKLASVQKFNSQN